MNNFIMNPAIVKITALLATGLLAGAFFYGLFNVAATFKEVPLEVHLIYRIQLMKHNSIVMQLLMLLSMLLPLWYAISIKENLQAKTAALFAVTFALASFLITRFGNVPINGLIKTWQINNLPDNWSMLLKRWDMFHMMRTATAFVCFFLMILSAHLASKNNLG
jgi:uncharacterized membrane protein